VVDAWSHIRAIWARGRKDVPDNGGGDEPPRKLGLSLRKSSGRAKVHGICTTGREPRGKIFFNLSRTINYKRVPNYRNLSEAERSGRLRDRGMNRAPTPGIPEEEAMRRIERQVLKLWRRRQGKAALFLTNTCTS